MSFSLNFPKLCNTQDEVSHLQKHSPPCLIALGLLHWNWSFDNFWEEQRQEEGGLLVDSHIQTNENLGRVLRVLGNPGS